MEMMWLWVGPKLTLFWRVRLASRFRLQIGLLGEFGRFDRRSVMIASCLCRIDIVTRKIHAVDSPLLRLNFWRQQEQKSFCLKLALSIPPFPSHC